MPVVVVDDVRATDQGRELRLVLRRNQAIVVGPQHRSRHVDANLKSAADVPGQTIDLSSVVDIFKALKQRQPSSTSAPVRSPTRTSAPYLVSRA